MSVYVSGHDPNNDMNTLDDVCYYLKRKTAYVIWEKLSPQEQAAVRDGDSAMHGIITPDGSYYSDGNEQVINLYTAGWPPAARQKLLSSVRYYLDELGVKYGPWREETSRMYRSPVVRIPVLHWQPTKNSPPLLNLSNGNADLIFGQLLGLPGEDGGYSDISVADLYRKIEEIERQQIDIHARDPYTSKTQGGPTMHHGGLGSEGIIARLEQIKKICLWALKNGYDKLYVA